MRSVFMCRHKHFQKGFGVWIGNLTRKKAVYLVNSTKELPFNIIMIPIFG